MFPAGIYLLGVEKIVRLAISLESDAYARFVDYFSWWRKGEVIYRIELTADVTVHIMRLVYYLNVWYMHGFDVTIGLFTLLLILDLYLSLQRRILINRNHLYRHCGIISPEECKEQIDHIQRHPLDAAFLVAQQRHT